MTKDELLGALSHDNLQAFLHLIREGESSNDESAYTTLNGGEHFTAPPWEHPNRIGVRGTSTAAGAYQFVIRTWKALATQYGFEDFSPINQDCGAVALIAQHDALDLVLAGRPLEAIRRINSKWVEWECFQNPKFIAKVSEVFAAYGGREPSADPAPVPFSAPSNQEVKPMGVFAALLPTILQSLPQLISVFGSPNDSEVAKRNQAAGVIVADTLVKATNAVNLQDAVDKIQSDPNALDAAHRAVNDLIPSLVEAGSGGIGGARKASADPAQLPFWKQPAFAFLIASVPLVYMLAVSVLFGIGGVEWSDDAKMMVATGILAVIAGGSAYFWGSSFGSQKKTDALVAK